MRILNGILCAVLLLFAALQLNDPDAILWFAIYAAAAIWPGLVAFRQELLASIRVLRLAGWAAIVGCGLGFIANVSTITSDWIHVETAREAFGYIICAAAIGVALYATRTKPTLRD